MRAIALFLFFFGASLLVKGQADTLNQYAEGRKNGTWRIYLNKQFKEVKDSNKAYFSRYKYYDYGLDLDAMGHCGKKWKLVDSTIDKQVSSKIKPMNGTYTWVDEKGITRTIITAKNGNCLVVKYYDPKGQLRSIWDYSKQWRGMAHAFSVILYDKKGNVSYYHFHKTNDKRKHGNYWGLYPSSKEEF